MEESGRISQIFFLNIGNRFSNIRNPLTSYQKLQLLAWDITDKGVFHFHLLDVIGRSRSIPRLIKTYNFARSATQHINPLPVFQRKFSEWCGYRRTSVNKRMVYQRWTIICYKKRDDFLWQKLFFVSHVLLTVSHRLLKVAHFIDEKIFS